MCTHKSKKISEVINKSDEDLNLHEIKAKTGAGKDLVLLIQHHQK